MLVASLPTVAQSVGDLELALNRAIKYANDFDWADIGHSRSYVIASLQLLLEYFNDLDSLVVGSPDLLAAKNQLFTAQACFWNIRLDSPADLDYLQLQEGQECLRLALALLRTAL